MNRLAFIIFDVDYEQAAVVTVPASESIDSDLERALRAYHENQTSEEEANGRTAPYNVSDRELQIVSVLRYEGKLVSLDPEGELMHDETSALLFTCATQIDS